MIQTAESLEETLGGLRQIAQERDVLKEQLDTANAKIAALSQKNDTLQDELEKVKQQCEQWRIERDSHMMMRVELTAEVSSAISILGEAHKRAVHGEFRHPPARINDPNKPDMNPSLASRDPAPTFLTKPNLTIDQAETTIKDQLSRVRRLAGAHKDEQR